MIDRVRITRISDRFLDAKKTIHSGTVISSFTKVINIITQMGVFTIQEASVPFTPLSIVMEGSVSLGKLGIGPEDKMEISDTKISCNGITFSVENAAVINTVLHPISPLRDITWLLPWYIDTLSEKLNEYAEANDASGLLDLSNHMEVSDGSLIFRDMTDENSLLNYFQAKLDGSLVFSGQLASRIASLLGLGFGLTPSCDDFIVGLLSTIAYAGVNCPSLQDFRDHLIQEIRLKLDTTTPVSSAFLDSAFATKFSEMILNFYQDFGHADERIRKRNIEEIASIGHSSGIDSLNGINFGLKLITAIL